MEYCVPLRENSGERILRISVRSFLLNFAMDAWKTFKNLNVFLLMILASSNFFILIMFHFWICFSFILFYELDEFYIFSLLSKQRLSFIFFFFFNVIVLLDRDSFLSLISTDYNNFFRKTVKSFSGAFPTNWNPEGCFTYNGC